MEHYHYVKCYLLATHATQDTDTVTLFQKHVPISQVELEDLLYQAVSTIVTILEYLPSTIALQLNMGDEKIPVTASFFFSSKIRKF